MTKSAITVKNQTTVPKEVREKLGVGPKDTLLWEVSGNTATVSAGRKSLLDLCGVLKVGPGSVEEDIRQARELRGTVKW
jgi:bifunctional DNA-binding transcriptional regulator/antitoxin component of YhaV-PrlF toxin-antitoxin module